MAPGRGKANFAGFIAGISASLNFNAFCIINAGQNITVDSSFPGMMSWFYFRKFQTATAADRLHRIALHAGLHGCPDTGRAELYESGFMHGDTLQQRHMQV